MDGYQSYHHVYYSADYKSEITTPYTNKTFSYVLTDKLEEESKLKEELQRKFQSDNINIRRFSFDTTQVLNGINGIKLPSSMEVKIKETLELSWWRDSPMLPRTVEVSYYFNNGDSLRYDVERDFRLFGFSITSNKGIKCSRSYEGCKYMYPNGKELETSNFINKEGNIEKINENKEKFIEFCFGLDVKTLDLLFKKSPYCELNGEGYEYGKSTAEIEKEKEKAARKETYNYIAKTYGTKQANIWKNMKSPFTKGLNINLLKEILSWGWSDSSAIHPVRDLTFDDGTSIYYLKDGLNKNRPSLGKLYVKNDIITNYVIF